MAFYNMLQGDARYTKQLADSTRSATTITSRVWAGLVWMKFFSTLLMTSGSKIRTATLFLRTTS
jgi:hypothetical protein